MPFLPKPWLLVGALVALIATALAGFDKGRKIERAAWLARANEALRANITDNNQALEKVGEAYRAGQARLSDLETKGIAYAEQIAKLEVACRLTDADLSGLPVGQPRP